MEQQVVFKSELSEKHKLFLTLMRNPPRWWSTVKNNSELYIEIRKGNSINIYYKGSSIAKIEYDDKSDKITVVTHPKYLGRENYDDATCYFRTERKGQLVYMPKYQDCKEWLENRLDEMLLNVNKYNNSKEKQEQARMILSNRVRYIDSEFEHLYRRCLEPNGKYKNDFMRIDLVELRDNTIHFVELKMISDGRLLKKNENESPEIYEQMQKYRNFAEKYQTEIVDYYRTLYKIKKNLELPVGKDIDTKAMTIDTTPMLVIADNYDRYTSERTRRIKSINNKMKQKRDVFDFEPLAVG